MAVVRTTVRRSPTEDTGAVASVITAMSSSSTRPSEVYVAMATHHLQQDQQQKMLTFARRRLTMNCSVVAISLSAEMFVSHAIVNMENLTTDLQEPILRTNASHVCVIIPLNHNRFD